MKRTEINAADALLDRSLILNIPAPWLLRLFGIKTIPYRMKRPTVAVLLRISRLFIRISTDPDDVKAGNMGKLLNQVAADAVLASRIVAAGMIRSGCGYTLLHRMLARYLRNNMDMRGLAELTKVIVITAGAEDFVSIIRSVGNLSITAPTLSQEVSGS